MIMATLAIAKAAALALSTLSLVASVAEWAMLWSIAFTVDLLFLVRSVNAFCRNTWKLANVLLAASLAFHSLMAGLTLPKASNVESAKDSQNDGFAAFPALTN